MLIQSGSDYRRVAIRGTRPWHGGQRMDGRGHGRALLVNHSQNNAGRHGDNFFTVHVTRTTPKMASNGNHKTIVKNVILSHIYYPIHPI
jgi:hypothetical protein